MAPNFNSMPQFYGIVNTSEEYPVLFLTAESY